MFWLLFSGFSPPPLCFICLIINKLRFYKAVFSFTINDSCHNDVQSFSSCSLADGEFVVHTFITCRVFDLYGQTKEIVEEFLCISNFHRCFEFQLCSSVGVHILAGLLVELVERQIAISQLLAFVDSQSTAKSFLEVCTDSFYLLVWCHSELCVREVVFD